MTASADQERARQRRRILTFTRWLLAAFVLFPLYDVYLFAAFGDVGALVLASGIVGLIPVVLWSRRLARRDHVESAVAVLVVMILAASLAIVILRTYLYPVLAAGAVLAVAIALPFVRTPVLRQLAIVAWADALLITAVGVFLPPPFEARSPALAKEFVTGAALAVALGLIVLMVWFYSSRLNTVLADATRAHEALRGKNSDLQTIQAQREQFMSVTAHEMGTPMTPLRVQIHLLQGGALGALTPTQKESVEILSRNFARLERLATELLDTSRVEAKRLKINRQSANVADVAYKAIRTHASVAEKYGIVFSHRIQPQAMAEIDEVRIAQVMDNLVSNALKYTPRGGHVEVVLRRVREGVEFIVTDDGVGMTREAATELFQPYGRLRAPLHGQATTGLGLFVARGIVEAHEGRIWARSDGPDLGSTFGFLLPTQLEPAAPAANWDGHPVMAMQPVGGPHVGPAPQPTPSQT